MIILLFFSFLQATILNYQAGTRYTYDFNSLLRMEAMNIKGDTRTQTFKISASTHFSCLYADNTEFVFEMTAENIRIEYDGSAKTKLLQESGRDLSASFSLPIIFTLNNLGKIYDVQADPKDTEEILNMKVAMMETIRTPVESDGAAYTGTAGQYYEHAAEFPTKDGVEINTFYTESDFVHHRDDAVDESMITLDGETTKRISKGIVTESTQRVSVNFAPRADPTLDTSEIEEQMAILSNGFTTVSLADTATMNSAFESTDAARRHRTRKPVPFMDPLFYRDRKRKQEAEIDQSIFTPTCPNGIDLCKSFGLGGWLGNKTAGFHLTGSVLAGTNKGCDNPTRNYHAGAYLNLDFYIFEMQFTVVQAYAEYGYVNGVAARNAMEVQVFGYSVAKKTFPDAPCTAKTQPMLNTRKSKEFSYTHYVLIVPITFSIGASFSLKVDVPYFYCFTTGQASLTVYAVAKVDVYVAAGGSVYLAEGGIVLSARAEEILDPTGYIALEKCQIGLKATSERKPFTAELYGRIRYWASWSEWGPYEIIPFWSWSLPATTNTLLDSTFGV